MAATLKNAEDIGLSVSVNGQEIPSSSVKGRIKGKKGSGNKYSAEILSIKGKSYNDVIKKIRKALKKVDISGSQYSMTVRSAVASKSAATETGQVLVKLSKDKNQVKSVKLLVIYHNAKGTEKKKFITVKKDNMESYSAESGILTFKGNLSGSVKVKGIAYKQLII